MNTLFLLTLTLAPGVQTLAPGVQEPEGVVAGRVVDLLDKPLAAVKVVLVHRPIPFCLDVPEVVLSAVTNAHGMFRTKLPVGRAFSAWASWDKGATAIAEGVTAKSFVTLVQDPGARQEKILVTGAGAWAELGPLSYRVVAGSENIHFRKVTQQGDHLILPPLPNMPYRPVEVLGKDGTVLWVDQPELQDDNDDKGKRIRTFALPPLATVKVVVLDVDKKPVAGAEVRRHIRNYWYTRSASVPFDTRFLYLWPVVGLTDPEGKLALRVPLHAVDHRQDLHFMVRHRGYRPSLSGWYMGKRYRNSVFTKGDEKSGDLDTLTFDLQKATAPAGHLRTADAPYSGPILLKWMVNLAGGLGNPFHETVLSSAEGKFTCPAPRKDWHLDQAWILLPDGLRQQVARRLGAAPPTAFALTTPGSLLKSSGAGEPFVRETNQAIRVITQDGRPADRALVIAAPVRDGQPALHVATFVRTNRVGRALIPKVKTDQLLLAVTPRGWIARRLSPGEDAKLLSLNLLARPTVAGRVIDENDSPVAGAYVANAPFRGGDSVLETDRNVKVLPASVVGYVLNLLGPVATDSKGQFLYPLLPVDYEVRVGVVTGGLGTVRGTESDPFSCAPGDKPQPVVLTYPLDRR